MLELLKSYQAKAAQLDSEDPLKKYRSYFSLPKDPKSIYLCNNSLGLPASAALSKISEQFQNWVEFGAEGWFKDKSNWYNSYDVPLNKPLSNLLGAKYHEVIVMNSLTVNLHLSHAAGNISLHLHDWGIDFAVGCSYKYLCSGPGGPGIAFVHESHHDKDLPRFSGWWGNDPKTRFKMQLQGEFLPFGGAYSWQVSTPSILSMIPLMASFEVFEEVGFANFRKKSELHTASLLELLESVSSTYLKPPFEVITPKNPDQRGCQLSLLIYNDCKQCLEKLEHNGVICDFRPPNVIRVTPSPFYNTYHDIYEFVCHLSKSLISM